MRRLVKKVKKNKRKALKTVEVKSFKGYDQMEIDSKAALLQKLIPLGLMCIHVLMKRDMFFLKEMV